MKTEIELRESTRFIMQHCDHTEECERHDDLTEKPCTCGRDLLIHRAHVLLGPTLGGYCPHCKSSI